MALTNVIQFSNMNKSSPQIENGYTPIANELLEQIISFGLSKNELLTVLAIARMTYGYSRKSDSLSHLQISVLINIDRANVSRSIESLVSKKIIVKHEEGRYSHGVFVNQLSINKHYDNWITGVKTTPVLCSKEQDKENDNKCQNNTSVEMPLVSNQHSTGVKTTPVTGVKTTRGLVSKQHTHKAIKTNKTIPKNNSVHFDEFWTAYPNKVAKKKAQDSFDKINPDDELFSLMLSAISESLKTENWIEQNGKYIPMPATWLNGERWNDVLESGASYSESHKDIFMAYNKYLPNAGWPDALDDDYLASRAAAINTFLNIPRMNLERANSYFSHIAEKIAILDNAGFDWMIKPETVIGMRENKFKAKK
jgi:phage replication O-like protein O